MSSILLGSKALIPLPESYDLSIDPLLLELFNKGVPSTMYNGSLDCVIDPIPLIITRVEAPGCAGALMSTPAIFPESDSKGLLLTTFVICSLSTVVVAYPKAFFLV